VIVNPPSRKKRKGGLKRGRDSVREGLEVLKRGMKRDRGDAFFLLPGKRPIAKRMG